MDAENLAREQHGLVASWQLLDHGWSEDKLRWQSRRWRRVHQGVWATGHNPLSQDQLHWAASLTTNESVVSHASAGTDHGFFSPPRGFTIISRPGAGGREHWPGLLVCHSKLLDGDVLRMPGRPPVTCPARSVLDLVGVLPSEAAQRRVVRDALRIEAVTPLALAEVCRRHRGRRGVARLRAYVAEYGPLPATRSRSDAEVLALATLVGAGEDRPDLNVSIGGYEADLVWHAEHVIIELDGPQFHQFESENAIRDAAWSACGYAVHRVSTDVVYDDPNAFIRFARAARESNRPKPVS